MAWNDPTEDEMSNALKAAHEVKTALMRPIPERIQAAQAISSLTVVAAEYRAQRDALKIRVAALEEENRKLRGLQD